MTSSRRYAPTGSDFPLALTGATASAHRVAHERERRLPHENLTRLGRLLQPRGDIHRIAGHERLATRWVTRDDLTGVDTDPQRDPPAEAPLELLVQ